MILLNGVSGFNGPDPQTDGEQFKKLCFSIILSLGGKVLSYCEPDVARHYYIVKVKVLEQELYILLNLIYPFATFATSVDPGNIKFLHQEKLSKEFQPYYRVLSPNELNEPLQVKEKSGRIIVENNNELNEAELGLIKHFQSKTVGDIVFNYWD